MLWNDIAYPPGPELPALMAHYYAAVPDGVVNDRWSQPGEDGALTPSHYDFRTPEYAQYSETIAPGSAARWRRCCHKAWALTSVANSKARCGRDGCVTALRVEW